MPLSSSSCAPTQVQELKLLLAEEEAAARTAQAAAKVEAERAGRQRAELDAKLAAALQQAQVKLCSRLIGLIWWE